LKLLVTKYRSGSGVSLEEVNYFSQLPKTTVGTIDLADYLIKDGISEISYAHSAIDKDNNFYLETGEVNLKCSNVIEGWGSLGEYSSVINDTLLDFFEYYNIEGKYFFRLQIWNDERAEPIWAGTIDKNNISIPKRSDEIINITAVSLDKEFSEYFSNKLLPGFDSFPTITSVILNLDGLNLARCSQVLESCFPNVLFDFQNDSSHFLHSYYVADKSYIYAPLATPLTNGNTTLTIKAGYDPFVLAEFDRFAFFHDVVKGMGWKWQFVNETITIKKRYDASSTLQTLDFETDFISHGVEIRQDSTIDTVLIEDGEYYGGNNSELSIPTATNIIDEDDIYHYVGGKDKKQYSESFGSNYNYNTPYAYLVPAIANTYVRFFGGWDFIKLNEDSPAGRTQLHYFYDIDYNSAFDFQKLNAMDNNTISMDLITNQSYPTSLDITASRTTNSTFYGNGNSYSVAHNAGNNGIYMYGNPCHSLLRLDTNLNRFETYEAYTNTQEFRNNFATLCGSGNKIFLKVIVNEIITDVDAMYKIMNYPYEDIESRRFSVNSASVDLTNQISILELVGQ